MHLQYDNGKLKIEALRIKIGRILLSFFKKKIPSTKLRNNKYEVPSVQKQSKTKSS